MAKTAKAPPCPSCKQDTRRHCDGRDCRWFECRRCHIYGDGKRWARRQGASA